MENSYLFQGKLGDSLSTEDGILAIQLCALNVLAHIDSKVGFKNLEGLNHFDMYYRASSLWGDAPRVANGASDIFLRVLNKKGNHSRAIFGVHSLPREFSVGITATFSIKNDYHEI